MPQMAGAGVLVKLLTDIPYNWSIVLVGVSMIVYVGFGGMIATTWVQIVNAVLILAAGAVILVMAMLKFKDRAIDQAEAKNGAKYMLPGNYLKNSFDQISLGRLRAVMIARIAALVIDGMTIGLVSSVILAMIDTAMRGADALWPLVNPTIVSLPLGFLGTVNQLLI